MFELVALKVLDQDSYASKTVLTAVMVSLSSFFNSSTA